MVEYKTAKKIVNYLFSDEYLCQCFTENRPLNQQLAEYFAKKVIEVYIDKFYDAKLYAEIDDIREILDELEENIRAG